MKVFINPGHDLDYDSGAVNPNSGLRECDVAANIGALVKSYLEAAGCEVKLLQSDNLCHDSQYADRPVAVCDEANDWPEMYLYPSIVTPLTNGRRVPRWNATVPAVKAQDWRNAFRHRLLIA